MALKFLFVLFLIFLVGCSIEHKALNPDIHSEDDTKITAPLGPLTDDELKEYIYAWKRGDIKAAAMIGNHYTYGLCAVAQGLEWYDKGRSSGDSDSARLYELWSREGIINDSSWCNALREYVGRDNSKGIVFVKDPSTGELIIKHRNK
ncbi:hypothetical protein JNK13_02345 [bacterium]|nr:hypothetical protein [bacterium]